MIPGFTINEEIVSALIEKGLASKEDFMEIYDKSRKKVVAYQIYPKHTFSGFCEDNNMRLVDSCSNCGLLRYEPNDDCSFVEPWIIVSKEVYEVMTSFISNKNFIPILNNQNKK